MIIDGHVHVFPSQSGSSGYRDVKDPLSVMQRSVDLLWGRMVSSHTDRKYVPEPDEDVGFTVGKFGRYHWHKHGQDCWLQRFPVSMEEPAHPPEQMLAHMDFVGVDMGIILGGYMEPNWGRDVYVTDVIKRWPQRFIGTVMIEYDLTRDDEYLQGEIGKMTRAVEELGYKGLFSHVPVGQPLDDPRCEPLWKEVARMGIPAFINTEAKTRAEYLDQIRQIESVCRKHPEMHVLDTHIGQFVRHPRDPQHVDNPTEFFQLLGLGNFHLEVGYVLSYENWAVWGRNFEYPYPLHEQIIKTIYERFGPEVLVWGSDMPFAQRTCTYQQNLDTVRLHTEFMSEEDRKLVMGDNLAKLFKVAPTR